MNSLFKKILAFFLIFIISSFFVAKEITSNYILMILFFLGLILCIGIAYKKESKLDDYFSSIDCKEDSVVINIFLSSFLVLFFELVLIRYFAALVPIFGYLKNMILLSCFFGFGLGFSLGEKQKNYLPMTLFLMIFQVIFLYGTSFVLPALGYPIKENGTISINSMNSIAQVFYVVSFIVLVFVFNTLTCIPVGHYTSNLMSKKNSLVSYSINLLGSIAGILTFSILSFFRMPPFVWFTLVVLIILWFIKDNKKVLLLASMASILLVSMIAFEPDAFFKKNLKIYSPYQLLVVDFNNAKNFYSNAIINISHNYHQIIFDLTKGNLEGQSEDKQKYLNKISTYYNNAYMLANNLDDVLIVGAGSGNDVAAAIRNGAKSIDAVEIDPEIVNLGKILHPEKPYFNSKVNVHINDARTYMKITKKKYDLIVYGLLDSQSALGSLSNVRLDSFVYTVEAFKQARLLLKDDGLVSLSFGLTHPLQGIKIFKMLQKAFDGQKPVCIEADYYGGTTFIIGPGLSKIKKFVNNESLQDVTAKYDTEENVDLSTDDWPFIYMFKKIYPFTYLFIILLLFLVSTDINEQILGKSFKKYFNLRFFLFGAGFMLIETKGITQLGLTFGNTWYVISAIILTIILFAFISNLVVIKVQNIHLGLSYALLLTTIFIESFFHLSSNLDFLPTSLVPLAQLVVLCSPILFSGLVFSTELKNGPSIPGAFSSNLLGSMLGGFLEYNSMFLGYHNLSWVALAIYSLAFISYIQSYMLNPQKC